MGGLRGDGDDGGSVSVMMLWSRLGRAHSQPADIQNSQDGTG